MATGPCRCRLYARRARGRAGRAGVLRRPRLVRRRHGWACGRDPGNVRRHGSVVQGAGGEGRRGGGGWVGGGWEGVGGIPGVGGWGGHTKFRWAYLNLGQARTASSEAAAPGLRCGWAPSAPFYSSRRFPPPSRAGWPTAHTTPRVHPHRAQTHAHTHTHARTHAGTAHATHAHTHSARTHARTHTHTHSARNTHIPHTHTPMRACRWLATSRRRQRQHQV